MKIAFNPSTVAALTTPPNNKDITFDLRGRNIFAQGVKFYGTDTNTWRDIKINNVSIGSHTLDLQNGSNTTLTNTNGIVTINSTWRPVVDNLTSDSTTSSLSAKQGIVLKALIDGKSNSDHNHDGRYLRLSGQDTMQGNLYLHSHGTSYIGKGLGDKSGADFTEANIVIRSWWGISFKSHDDIVRTYIDTRTGNIGTKGVLNAVGAAIQGRVYNDGDDEGIIIKPASNGYAGLILGTHNGERSVFYLREGDPFWRYNDGLNTLDIQHPKKPGVIALTSDIPSKDSWNYDGRYLRLSGQDTMQGNLYLHSHGTSYIGKGLGDKSGADFTEANIVIRSWWGISFKSHDDIVRTYIDTRTGNIGTKGVLNAVGAAIQGRVYNDGDDEGIIIKPASNGYAGLILGTHNGERSVFYLREGDPFWRYNDGLNTLDIQHPKKPGVIALTSDIPSKDSWNYDDRYLRLTGGWMSGDINFGDDNKIYWERNTGSVSISFKNYYDWDDDSYMSFVTSDNGNGYDNEYFRWSHNSGLINTEWMTLKSDGLRVRGTKVSLEGHTHTVFKNNLMIKGTDGISDSASIHLGIGDSDTGFKWISDGVCQIYANNVAVGQWTSGGMDWFKNPTVNGNKVWNAGNDGSGSGLDADTLDGYHENSFLRYRGDTSTDQEATLWSQIGIKQYNNALPDNLTGVYSYGSVISLPGFDSRFEIYVSHQSSTGNGLYYRSGWGTDRRAWLKFIDSSNIGSQSVNYANSAGNADTLGGISRNYGLAPFGTIPFIGNDGVMAIGRYIDFHFDNSGSYGYSTRICTTGNYQNTVKLPSASGTLALTSYGGDYSTPIFLGYLNLYHGNDGTISSSFYCLGYSVPFTYTRGGNYCKIIIPDTTYLSFYISAAIASVNYSGGGMDTWVGQHRGAGAWWLHCYASGRNEVRVKGFRSANSNNDSWWGGNPLYADGGGANIITVCIFGHANYK